MKSPGDRGYIMVVLLVGMGITAIWMTAALPAWRHQVQRQREDELIFIGEQYARAIVFYQRKNRGAFPPSIEVLVTQRHLRKAWKDPITGEDFAPIGIGVQTQGQPTGGTPGRNTGPGIPQQPGRGGTPQTQPGQFAGISGVRSRSQETSIKVYKNLQQHSLWPFDAAQMYPAMGNPNQQQGNPGAPGGPGGGRGPGGPGGGPGGPGGPGTGRGGDGRGGPTGPIGPGRGRGGGF